MGAIITGLLPLITSLFNRVFPDPVEAAREQAAFVKQLIDVASKADTEQNEVNKEEAKSFSLFVAGWRPAIGWVCAMGCFWAYIGQPVTQFTLASFGIAPNLPMIDTNSMMGLTMGLLGMAGLRTIEHINGVSTSAITKAK